MTPPRLFAFDHGAGCERCGAPEGDTVERSQCGHYWRLRKRWRGKDGTEPQHEPRPGNIETVVLRSGTCTHCEERRRR